MEKLIPIRTAYMQYKVPIPKRLKETGILPATITIKFAGGEYQYIPRENTFCRFTRFSADELLMIAEELKRLNR